MGGLTKVFLKDISRGNIDKHNARLELNKVPKKYRYYSEQDIRLEYEAFLIGDGVFEERFFPKDKINSLEDFKKYWSPEALGEVFVPHVGTLQFDCYFGRTSKRAMRNIGRYLVDNVHHIEKVSGSFSTFCERGMTKLEQEIMRENGFLD
jgi:hypothetical protein